MAFFTGLLPSEAFRDLKLAMANTKNHCATERQAFMQATTSADRVLALIRHLSSTISRIDSLASTPGIDVWAQSECAAVRPSYDVVAEYSATRSALVNTRTQLMSMFPKEAGTNYLLYQVFDAVGTPVARTFTAAQLAPVVSLLDTLLSTLD